MLTSDGGGIAFSHRFGPLFKCFLLYGDIRIIDQGAVLPKSLAGIFPSSTKLSAV